MENKVLEDDKKLLVSEDDFLSGRLKIMQPKHGFRAGIDSVLLAAAVNINTQEILELGAGSGVAACCALADIPLANATLLERDVDVLDLAQINLQKNGFLERTKTIILDITQKGSVRQQAGLRSDFYTSIIANPPFFDAHSGTVSKQAGRAGSRHMPSEDLDKWVKSAASSAAAGGEVLFIHAISALPKLLASFEARFGNISILPISPREGKNASRMLIRGIKGSRAPFALLPPLVLHGKAGNNYTSQAEAIFRGKSRISWNIAP